MIPFNAHESGEALAAALAREAAETLRAAIAVRGRALFAAPGGSTPAAFLAALAAEPLDRARLTVLPGDERWVPPGDDRSNEGMIRRAMPGVRILPFWRAGEAPEEAAPRLSAELAPLLPLDLAVIGMGEDMHCASLFPGAEALQAALAADAPAVMAISAPGAIEPRLTLTLPPLAGAGRLVLLIRGEAKRAALARAMETEDGLAAPVSAVLRAAASAKIRWSP